MPQDFYDPVAHIVQYIDSQRQQTRQAEDSELDRRISLLHDMISGPGANPARTAQGIQGILELGAAKGGRGKAKSGMSGYMGEHELPMPDMLAGLIHGSIPFQGPTTESYQQDVKPAEYGNPTGPIDAGTQVSPQFTGQSVLDEKIPVPPVGSQVPIAPTGARMLSAAQQMTMQRPVANQPIRMSPDEQAQQEGRSAGIKAGGQLSGQMESEFNTLTGPLGVSPDTARTTLMGKFGMRAPVKGTPAMATVDGEANVPVMIDPVNNTITRSDTHETIWGAGRVTNVQTLGKPSTAAGGSGLKQVKAQDGSVWNVHPDGTATPLMDPTGKQITGTTQVHFIQGMQGNDAAFQIRDNQGNIVAKGLFGQDQPQAPGQPAGQPPAGQPPVTPPPAGPPAAPNGSGTPAAGKVQMRAPDGSVEAVDPAEVEHYKSLGATVVKGASDVPTPPAANGVPNPPKAGAGFTPGKPTAKANASEQQFMFDMKKLIPMVKQLDVVMKKNFPNGYPANWVHGKGSTLDTDKARLSYNSGHPPQDDYYKALFPLADLTKIMATAPYIKGIRNYHWIEQIQKHTPKTDIPFPDTPANIVDKMANLKGTLNGIAQEMGEQIPFPDAAVFPTQPSGQGPQQ